VDESVGLAGRDATAGCRVSETGWHVAPFSGEGLLRRPSPDSLVEPFQMLGGVGVVSLSCQLCRRGTFAKRERLRSRWLPVPRRLFGISPSLHPARTWTWTPLALRPHPW